MILVTSHPKKMGRVWQGAIIITDSVFFIPSLTTVLNWDDKVMAPCDESPCVAWRTLEILVVFTTAFKWESTWPMKVKQSLA